MPSIDYGGILPHEMITIFLDGESKSGKTAVGRHIKQTLEAEGHRVRLIVAGNFFRTVTWLILQKGSDKDLESISKEVLEVPELTDEYNDSQLQSNEVDALVSQVGSLDIVQEAAIGWRINAAQRALDDGIYILLYDGRNLRSKLSDWSSKAGVKTALELIIYCHPDVAAKRYLSDEGNKNPSEAELKQTTDMITTRREMDRKRKEAAYVDPDDPIRLVAGTDNAKEAIVEAYEEEVANPPRPVLFDNSEVPLADGLATVEELTLEAVKRMEN